MELQNSETASALDTWVIRPLSRLSKLSASGEVRLIVGGCVVVGLTLILLLVLPGRTFGYKYSNDVLIFFDGAHRVLDGQLPSRDFHTPLGLLAYLFPAFGLWASGSLGGMMPIATAAFTLIALPMIIHVCVSRLPLGYAAIFALFVITLTVTPTVVGEEVTTFATFYNRWGYALLAILFVLPLPHRRGGNRGVWMDACVVATVLLLTFYMKISYFGIAAAFAAALLLFGPHRRAMGAGLAASLLGILVVHLFWHGTFAYFEDISSAAAVSGVLRGALRGMVSVMAHSAAISLAFVIILGIVIARKIPLWPLVLSLGMGAAGLLLANQNFQGPGVLTLVPAAIVALLSAPVRARTGDDQPHGFAAVALLAVLAFPQFWGGFNGLLRHTVGAVGGGTRDTDYTAEIDGFLVQEFSRPDQWMPNLDDLRVAYRNGSADLDRLGVARLQSWQTLPQPEYFWTIQDAVDLLRRNPTLTGGILAFDMANPLNALTGRSAPRGMDSWFHLGRTVSPAVYRDPDELFADVGVVMVPKDPLEPETYWFLRHVYGEYVAQHYELVATSDYWQAYKRRSR